MLALVIWLATEFAVTDLYLYVFGGKHDYNIYESIKCTHVTHSVVAFQMWRNHKSVSISNHEDNNQLVLKWGEKFEKNEWGLDISHSQWTLRQDSEFFSPPDTMQNFRILNISFGFSVWMFWSSKICWKNQTWLCHIYACSSTPIHSFQHQTRAATIVGKHGTMNIKWLGWYHNENHRK